MIVDASVEGPHSGSLLHLLRLSVRIEAWRYIGRATELAYRIFRNDVPNAMARV